MPEKKQDQPRSVGSFWKIIRDLSAIGGIIFFFLIALEWSYVSGFYDILGARILTRIALETAPGKYGIGVHLFEFLIKLLPALGMGVAAGEWGLRANERLSLDKKLDEVLKHYMPHPYEEFRVILSMGVLALVGYIIIDRCSWENPTTIQIGVLTVVTYLGIHKANHSPHWARWSMYAIINLLAVSLIWDVSLFVFRAGQEVANRVLAGEISLPGVAIITNVPLPVSPAVDVDRGYNWRYYPREVPNTDNLVFSLQYVGEDENDVYILDYVARRVIVVPREEIHSMVLFPTATFRRGVPMIVNPRVSTPVQHATFSPLPLPSSSGR